MPEIDSYTSPTKEQKDQQCRQILQILIQRKACSHEKAVSLWRLWEQTSRQDERCTPSRFFLQQGVPSEALKTILEFLAHRELSRTEERPKEEPNAHSRGTNVRKSPAIPNLEKRSLGYGSSPTQGNDPLPTTGLQEKNADFAKAIEQENLVDQKILRDLLEHCNKTNVNLGQTLVKQRHLQMSDLVRLMKVVSGSTSTDGSTSAGEIPSSKESSVSPNAATKKEDTGTRSQDDNLPGTFKGITGSTFAEYQILGEIARGGMGIVYKAMQPGMKRILALKILLAGESADSTQVKRFFREARATATLNHPNIIPIYSTGEFNNYHYFTMKYIDGCTFQNVIESDDSLEKKIELLVKVCKALHFAHEKNILHRDVKPTNVLLDKNGEPYVTDFGLAKFIDSNSALTQSGTTLGTPYFMPPEQIQADKKKIDRRSDVYSLGVILYQILAKKLPFEGDTLTELYKKVLEDDAPCPQGAHPFLWAICLKGMEKKQEFRYSTAQEMADDLEAFQQGKKPKAMELNFRVDFSRWKRRHRKALLFTFGIFMPILLLSLLGVYGVYYFQEQQKIRSAQVQMKVKQSCNEAQNLCQAGDYEKAVQVLELALKYAPDASPLCFELAQLYHKLEKPEKARPLFEKALQLEPENDAIVYRKASFHQESGESLLALDLIERYIKKNPSLPNGYRLRSQALKKLGKDRESEADVATADDIEKKKLAVLFAQVEKHVQEKDILSATRILDAVARDYPSYEKTYWIRGQLYHQEGQYQKALQDISQAIEIRPSFDAMLLKAKWLRHAGYVREAYQSLLHLSQKNTDEQLRRSTLEYLADVEFELKEYASAYRRYDSLSRESEQNELLFKLARCAFYIQEYEAAQRHLDKISEAWAKDHPAEILYYRGCLERRQNEKKAASFFTRSLAQGSYKANESHLALGEILFAHKRYSKAIPYLEKAALAFPDNIELQFSLGTAHYHEKEYEKAILSFSKCIEVEPWKPAYYYYRAKAYSEANHYEMAEKDFIKCHRLEPDNIMPFVEFFTDIFRKEFLRRVDDMKILFDRYVYNAYDGSSIDLFEEEVRKLSMASIQQAIVWKEKNKSRNPWDERKAKIYIKGLIESESTAVHEMAYTGLMDTYYEPKLLGLLEEEIGNKKYLNRVKSRLQDIRGKIEKKYLEEEKVYLRQLLARYYQAKDEEALKEIYHKGEPGILGLASLLMDEKESEIMRYFAACSLIDLRMPSAYEVLKKQSAFGDEEIRLLCNIAFARDKKELSPQSFEKIGQCQKAFFRALVAKHIPLAGNEAVIEKLLQDDDDRVRVQAAARLRGTLDERAERELVRGFSHASSPVRILSISTFWNFENIQKKMAEKEFLSFSRQRWQEHGEKLIEATESADIAMKRVAILRLSEVGPKEASEIVARHLRDSHMTVRFQAVLSLGQRMEMERVMPIILDSKEVILLRLAPFIGSRRSSKKPSRELAPQFMQLIKDKDDRVRMVAYWMIGKLGKGLGMNFSMSNLKSPDPYTRIGCLCSMADDGTERALSVIPPLFKDPHPDVRFTAATAAILLAGKYKSEELPKMHELVKEGDSQVKRGAALGYVKVLHDRVKSKPQESEKTHYGDLYNDYIHSMIDKVKEIQSYPKKSRDKENPTVEELISYFSKAVELDPQNQRYRFERGILYCLNGQYSESIADGEKALEMKKDNSFFKYFLAYVYHLDNQQKRAQELIEEFLVDFPFDYDGLSLKSQILARLDKREELQALRDRLSLFAKAK